MDDMGLFLLFLHFNTDWSLVSADNNCSPNLSRTQSILTRAQLKFDDETFQQMRVISIQVVDAQSRNRTHNDSAIATFVEAHLICT